MPHYKNITINVTDTDFEPFREYGAKTFDRKNMTSCFIQSETGKSFRLLIEADEALIRGPAPPSSPSGSENTQSSASGEGEVMDDDVDLEEEQEEDEEVEEVDWHLLATLRLDGKKIKEKSMFIFLNKSHDSFQERNRIIHGLREESDGRIREHTFRFQEVGIENVFGTMLSLGNQTEEDPSQDEDNLASALSGLGENGMEDAEEKTKAGQIEVTLERITLGATGMGELRGYRATDDMDADAETFSNVSHMISREKGNFSSKRRLTTNYETIDSKNDPPYATFKFYYKKQADLCKLFPDILGSANTPRTSRLREARDALKLASASPLSIMQPTPPRPGAYTLIRSAEEEDIDEEEAGDDASAASEADGGDGEYTIAAGYGDDDGAGEKLGGLDIRKREADEDEDDGGEKKAKKA